MVSRNLLAGMTLGLALAVSPSVSAQNLTSTFGQGSANTGAGGATQQGASQTARNSGIAGARTGSASSSAGGLGTMNRIDRSSRTAANPLQTRGYNVLGGDAMQMQGNTSRQTNMFGPQMFGGQFNQGGFNQNANRRQNAQRPQYSTRITFTTPEITPGAPNTVGLGSDPVMAVQQAVSSFPASSIHVAMEDGFVVLRGSVSSEADRRVAEKMAKLEPGVDRVKNELVVAATN